jgi:hypothetical protein
MTDRHPPLDDRERGLLCYLAVQVIAAQTGDPEDAVAGVLDEFAADGQVAIWRDQTDAVLTVCGRVIVHAQRAWLHVAAHRADPAMN